MGNHFVVALKVPIGLDDDALRPHEIEEALNDLWLAADSRIMFGLPVGLTYHVGFCIIAAMLMAALTRWAWPRLDIGDEPS